MVITMKKLKILYILLAVAFVFLSDNQAYSANNYIFLVTNQENVGDHNQAVAIANALKPQLAPETVEEQNFSAEDRGSLLNAVAKTLAADRDNKIIIIGAGEASILTLAALPQQPNVFIVHSSHQLTKQHILLRDHANVVALPWHAVTNKDLDKLTSPVTSVVTTYGVVHNLTPEVIQAEYEANQGKIPSSFKYLGVILGGDAPTPGGKTLYYTPNEAAKLASYLATIRKSDQHLLILNSSRTGKHNPHTGAVIPGTHVDERVDAVTAAFIHELERNGLKREKDFSLFDFHHKQPSYYKIILGALLVTESPLVVAGELTLMVSEAADCLPQGLVTAYFHSAMNKNHIRHCEAENKAGRINLLYLDQGKGVRAIPAFKVSSSERQTAADFVAKAVYARLQQLNKVSFN
jgi:hypothetical protein